MEKLSYLEILILIKRKFEFCDFEGFPKEEGSKTLREIAEICKFETRDEYENKNFLDMAKLFFTVEVGKARKEMNKENTQSDLLLQKDLFGEQGRLKSFETQIYSYKQSYMIISEAYDFWRDPKNVL